MILPRICLCVHLYLYQSLYLSILVFSGKRGLSVYPWCIIPSNTWPNYGSIKSNLSNTRLNHDVEWSSDMQKNSKIAKNFDPC